MIELAGGIVSSTTDWKNPGTTVAVTSSLSLYGTPTPTLTIAAGTQFAFAQDKSFEIAYSGGGNLKVNGTATAHVIFTSLNATKAAGDWAGIMLWPGAQATIQYADISYGGSGQASSSISGDVSVTDTGKATLTISNSKLLNSATYGLYIPCGTTATVNDTAITYSGNLTADKGPGPGC